MIPPINDVLLSSAMSWLHAGQYLGENIPNRKHDEVYETWLLSGHLNSVSVAQEGCWHKVFLFNVTLFEELLEKKVGPFSKAIELACWCA